MPHCTRLHTSTNICPSTERSRLELPVPKVDNAPAWQSDRARRPRNALAQRSLEPQIRGYAAAASPAPLTRRFAWRDQCTAQPIDTPSSSRRVAARRPSAATWHGVELVDDYAWLRADNWQEVMRDPAVLDAEIRAYLEAENAYCEAQLADTQPAAGRAVQRDEGPPQGGRQLGAGARRPVRLLLELRRRRPVSAALPPAARRRGRDRPARRQRRGRGQALLGPGQLPAQPRPQAARLRERRQGLRALHHPHPRSGDRPRPARQHPRHARRPRLGQRQQDALLRAPRRPPPPAARLPPRRRHAGRGRRPRLRGKGHRLLRRHLGRRSRPSSSSSTRTTIRRARSHLIDADAPTAPPRVVEPRQHGHEYSRRAPRRPADHHHQLGAARRTSASVEAPVAAPGMANWREIVPHRPGCLILDTVLYRDHMVRLEREDGLPRIVVRRLADGAEHIDRTSPRRPTRSACRPATSSTRRRCASSTRR